MNTRILISKCHRIADRFMHYWWCYPSLLQRGSIDEYQVYYTQSERGIVSLLIFKSITNKTILEL